MKRAGTNASELVRVQKVLAERGIASRRRAEELIAAGRVRLNGELVGLGSKVALDARIEIDGRVTAGTERKRYLALYKPIGIVSSARAERGRESVVDLVRARERLYPVGRLDVDSEGLVLLTNDGEWAERVLHPRYGVEREYEVDVAGTVSSETVERLRRGVRLEDGLARPVRVTATREHTLRVVLRTGWKRQVRRMSAAVGLRVRRLVRVRIGTLSLGSLRPGQWRELTPREVRSLAATATRAA